MTKAKQVPIANQLPTSPLEARLRKQLEETKVAHIQAYQHLENVKAEATRVQKEFEASIGQIKKDYVEAERNVLLLQQAAFTLENALKPEDTEVADNVEEPDQPTPGTKEDPAEVPEKVDAAEAVWSDQDTLTEDVPEEPVKGSSTRKLKIGSKVSNQ